MIPVPAVVLMDTDPMLRTVSREVTRADGAQNIRALIQTMFAIVDDEHALGLSAIQIGVPLRVLVMKVDGREIAMINPERTRSLNRLEVRHEGCLSVLRRQWGLVSRPAKCDVTWCSVDYEDRAETLTGMVARVFQHELDHLNGVLMTDYPTVR